MKVCPAADLGVAASKARPGHNLAHSRCNYTRSHASGPTASCSPFWSWNPSYILKESHFHSALGSRIFVTRPGGNLCRFENNNKIYDRKFHLIDSQQDQWGFIRVAGKNHHASQLISLLSWHVLGQASPQILCNDIIISLVVSTFRIWENV